MNPDLLHAAFRIAALLVVPSVILLFLLPSESAAYVITVITLIMGSAFLVLVVALSHYMNHR